MNARSASAGQFAWHGMGLEEPTGEPASAAPCQAGVTRESGECLRLAALHSLAILDTAPEACYDTITRLAADYLKVGCAYLAFVDEGRAWAKSDFRGGLKEIPRSRANASRVVEGQRTLVILDVEVDAPSASRIGKSRRAQGLRFFAGAPVRVGNGHVVGALCVTGREARELVTREEVSMLEHLADLAADQLELRQLRLQSQHLAGGWKAGAGQAIGRAGGRENVETEGGAGWPQPEDIREALVQDQFLLYYQPEIELSTSRIVGMEALIRWKHPDRGLVPPLDFIPEAEASGLILPLGDWGLGEACRQRKLWHRRWPQLESLRMCVNLSARQFSRIGLADYVESLLVAHGLAGHQLGLEMTESSLIPNMAEASGVLASFHQLGVGLLMDDFGTGYSSLSHLHRFPFDVLKVDRSFVQRMTEGAQPRQIVQTILELARVMEMDVIAEGIETEEQAVLLREMGCRYGQGYFFSPPMPAARMEEYLGRANAMVGASLS